MTERLDRPTLIINARIVDPARDLDAPGSMLIDCDGLIAACGPDAPDMVDGAEIIDAKGQMLAPGLVDMRVFVGEPGEDHRETLKSASRAAAAGGVTSMITMPDTDPCIDEPSLVDYLLRRSRSTAKVRVHPMAALTKSLDNAETTEFGLLMEAGAVAFTNGNTSIRNAQLMRRALTYGRDFSALIVHHTEDQDLVGTGVMHESELCTRLGLSGIPSAAETIMLQRDLTLVGLTDGFYHAAQLSSAQSLPLIQAAKARGLNVSAGVSVNHLALNENDIGDYRTYFKMSPPLRTEDDRLALIDGLNEGLLDVIVSTHNPRDVEEKRYPFAEAVGGAIGLETLLAAVLRLVHSGEVPLMTAMRAMTQRPAELLNLPVGTLKPGAPADAILVDLDMPWIYKKDMILSRSKNTPFQDARFQGKVMRTMIAGRTIFEDQA